MDAIDPALQTAGVANPASAGASAPAASASPSIAPPAPAAASSNAHASPANKSQSQTDGGSGLATPQHQHQHQQPADQPSPSPPTTPTAGGGDGTPGDPKKPRACEACRGLKVRCEPDPANPEGACRRCAKAGRACVVTQPTRKRQKKTDSRVAELEKKIDALTASLQASRNGPAGSTTTTAATAGGGGGGGGAAAAAAATAGGGTSSGTPRDSPFGPTAGSGSLLHHGLAAAASRTSLDAGASFSPFGGGGGGASAAAAAGARREVPVPAQREAGQTTRQPPFSLDLDSKVYPPPMVMAGQKRKFAEGRETAGDDVRDAALPAPPAQNGPNSEYSDVVDRGVLSMDKAAELFERYNHRMCHHLPGVVFSPETTVADIRKSKPILFLSLMASSSAEVPKLQRVLVKELMQVIAEKIIVVGEKSLELVQALLVAVIWYWPPEHFEELKFYQLVHIAAVMAIDIGLGRKKSMGRLRKHMPSSWREHPFKKNPVPDPTSLQSRRTWLTCYVLASNTSMALHRPNLIRWTPFMTECMDVLESSPDAAPTDQYLCHLTWLHRLSEEVGVQFSMDDPSVVINIADTRTQYALRGFERDLEKYRESIPPDMLQPSLLLSFHVISLYMHEIALQSENGEDTSGPMFSSERLKQAIINPTSLTPAHISALSACLTAIDGIFDVFLSMDIHDIRCIPVFNFVRVAYATVVLIKMYFSASSPNSELGRVVNKDNLKVEQSLEGLVEKFRSAAADDRSRPAAKFLVVLVMLRSWFQRQNQQEAGQTAGGNETGASGLGTRDRLSLGALALSQPQQQQQQALPGYPTTANTPLQLLSEVATNDHSAKGNTGAPNGSGIGSGRSTTAGTLGSLPSPWSMSSHNPQSFMYEGATTGASAGLHGADSTDPSSGPAATAEEGGGAAGAAAASDPSLLSLNGGVGASWASSPFSQNVDYMGGSDLFQQAMDLTLTGFPDGSSGQDGMRFVMQDSMWGSLMEGMPGSGAMYFNF